MNSFLISVVLCLTLNHMVVGETFCERYIAMASNRTEPSWTIPTIKFIVTAEMRYIYVNIFEGINTEREEYVYTLDMSCTNPKKDTCPTIGEERKLSDVFTGISKLRDVFFHNNVTYFILESAEVFLYNNTQRWKQVKEEEIWAALPHATVYEWKNNDRTVKSRFVPPKEPKVDSSRNRFSFDSFNGPDFTLVVEVVGNYDSVYIVKSYNIWHDKTKKNVYITLYSFGDYVVPVEYYGYLPLPNGDDIFNFEYKPAFVRKDDISLMTYNAQYLYEVFACDPSKGLNERVLTDTRSDNIYPSYFKQNSA